MEDNVREMAASISRELARNGPNAWLDYFVDAPGFFMTAHGKLQFADIGQAREFPPGFSAGLSHMELTWSDFRVDAISKNSAMMAANFKEVFADKTGHGTEFHGYFTGLAVGTDSGWKLRDAHWSAPMTP